LVNLTFRRPISLITGAEMEVMRRRTAAARMRKVPMWWTPLRNAMLT